MKKLTPIFFLLPLSFCLGIDFAVFTPPLSNYIGTFAFVSCLSGLLIFSNRHQDQPLRWIIFMVGESIILGFGIGFIIGKTLFIIVGVVLAVSILAWVSYLRFPVNLWPAIRLSRQKKTSQAIQKLNAILEMHPEARMAYILRYNIYLNNMQLAEAERDARWMLKLRPDSTEAYHRLAVALFSQARYEETKHVCEESLKLKPRNVLALYNLGRSCYRLGDYPGCNEYLSQVIRKTLPTNLSNLLTYYYLGRSLEMTGQTDLSGRAYQKMPRFSYDLKRYIEQTNSLPDHPEIVLLRNDLLDIDRRLSTPCKRSRQTPGTNS